MTDLKRRTNPSDPTAERTAEQSTQTASGLTDAEDVVDRESEERYRTPRKYEEEHEDAALPADDATLKTNI